MANTASNLYPPILPDANPSFIRTSTCKIYFSLSMYNSADDIKNVQISLINQNTNISALNSTKYPSGIKIATLHKDTNATNDYKYYVEIIPNKTATNSDLVKDKSNSTSYFDLNQYYIAQLRFTHKDAPNPPSNGVGLDTWLFDQRDYFSEWSNICLIKGIDAPKISITGLTQNQLKLLSKPLTKISGKLYYDNSTETEYLKSYNIVVYKTSSNINNPIFKSEQIYTNQFKPNEFNYDIPYDFDRDISYTLAFTYTTNNSYTKTLLYPFKIDKETKNILDGVAIITPEEDNGRIKFDIDFEYAIKSNTNLIIKRSSSKTNFKIWEVLKKIPHDVKALRHLWYDTTIESGIWYKYRIQQEDDLCRVFQTDKPVICTFEDIFLTDGDRQLRIQFNPTINDLKYNTMDSQQTTLGSKYPYVKRNGNNFFRSFSIGGLISALMDDKNWYASNYYDNKFRFENKRQTFTSLSEIYGESKNLYLEYNKQNKINEYQDYIYEREFRKKVAEFLYENDIKLFKSLTEGNILVKLQNISFQPINNLGRQLYSFSATAIEIDDINITNFNKYNIINKFYYTYKTETLNETFKGGYSIIKNYLLNLSSFSKYNTELLKVFRIDIQLQQNKNAVFYVKTINDSQPIRYTTKLQKLTLTFDNEQPIEDCYFYGVHLTENQYKIMNEYHYSTSEIQNPISGRVYYISKNSTDGHKINQYILYNRSERLLKTNEEESEMDLNRDYTLFTESDYEKYVFYNNKWYPFADNGDVLMPVKAQIIIYYEVKEEN